jgi:hypothetical protein
VHVGVRLGARIVDRQRDASRQEDDAEQRSWQCASRCVHGGRYPGKSLISPSARRD